MRILIVTPQVGRIGTGNVCSAEQWERLLADLGHEVEVVGAGADLSATDAEVLVALNAHRSRDSVMEFQRRANNDNRTTRIIDPFT